jgi:hypothetical protein
MKILLKTINNFYNIFIIFTIILLVLNIMSKYSNLFYILYEKILYQKKIHGWILCFKFLWNETHNKILFNYKYIYIICIHNLNDIFLCWKILDFDFALLKAKIWLIFQN